MNVGRINSTTCSNTFGAKLNCEVKLKNLDKISKLFEYSTKNFPNLTLTLSNSETLIEGTRFTLTDETGKVLSRIDGEFSRKPEAKSSPSKVADSLKGFLDVLNVKAKYAEKLKKLNDREQELVKELNLIRIEQSNLNFYESDALYNTAHKNGVVIHNYYTD